MEWCGIIARIHAVSSTVDWLRTRKSDTAKTSALPAKIAIFTPRLLYIPSINANMMTAITAPIYSAI